MLKHINSKLHYQLRYKKSISLSVTNRCNLACGSCSQLCNLVKSRWDATLEQFHINLEIAQMRADYNRNVIIFGGEPTLHPQWEEILEILKKTKRLKFVVCTNGRTKVKKTDNVNFKIDTLKKKKRRKFISTLMAPKDSFPRKPSKYFFKLAQKCCCLWKDYGVSLYNDRAYICTIAGAMDCVLGRKHGWKLEGANTFNKSDAEIVAQACQFCPRCQWCARKKTLQRINKKTRISRTNWDIAKKIGGHKKLVHR